MSDGQPAGGTFLLRFFIPVYDVFENEGGDEKGRN